ncbi:MAG: serine hydrolase [Alcanivoracaceae bacterium]|nr:serine hydrolase [Alcanivoracaceae bacterium]
MKKLYNFLSVVILVFLTSAYSVEATPSVEYIKKIIERKFGNEKLGVGISIVIYENSNAYFYNYGMAKKEVNELVTSEHILEIGSITKTFTTAVLADLVSQGIVSLNDPVVNYLPKEVKMPQGNGQLISLLDLATHRSGLPRTPTNIPPKHIGNPYAHYSVKDMYDFLSGYELTRDIGAEFEYSNIGMGLLGHVLHLKTGKTYEELVYDSVFKPLKMTSSFVKVPSSHEVMFTNGYNSDLSYIAHWQMPTLAGAGAIKSNTIDMLAYLKANLTDDSPISAVLKSTHKIYDDGPESGTKIGLGWNIITRGDNPYYWHNGQIGGFHSFIGFDKVATKGIVILANSRNDIDQIGHNYLNDTLKQMAVVKARVVIEIPIENLKKLEGKYEFSSEFFIKVSVEKGRLYVQATNQSRFPVFAKSATEFFLKVADADLEFELDEAGNAKALILIQNNQVMKGKKP